jgi:hypothetical protein
VKGERSHALNICSLSLSIYTRMTTMQRSEPIYFVLKQVIMSASWMAGSVRKYEQFFIHILQMEGPVGLLPGLISTCPVDGKVHLHPDCVVNLC